MARELVTEMFKVADSRGNQFVVRQVTTYVSGQLIGGGESISGVVYKLDSGAVLQAFLGSVDFVNNATGESYKRL